MLLPGLFILSTNLQAQSVLTNSNAYINIVDNARINGDTIDNLANGSIRNFGYIHLTGNYNNFLDATSLGGGVYTISGNWNNAGSFISNSSRVVMIDTFGIDQNIINTGTGSFHILEIDHRGFLPTRVFIRNNIEVTNSLRMLNGVLQISPNSNILSLSNPLSTSLAHTSGRIIGKFRRAINSQNTYLFPLGSQQTSYSSTVRSNFMNILPNLPPNPGSLTAEFIRDDPGDAGLPLQDTMAEVWDALEYGYWSLVPDPGFSLPDYYVNLQADGFTPIDSVTRIIKRDSLSTGPGDWQLDGVHRYAVNNVVARDTLDDNVFGEESLGIQLGIGRGRPRILEQPMDTTVCELDPASFYVKARGFMKKLFYQWQVNTGSGWFDIVSDSTNYSGYDSDRLLIDSAFLYMDGYRFRVIVTDRRGNFKISDEALLTVEPLPRVTATPQQEVICNNTEAVIELTSTLFGTTYQVNVLYSGSITGANGTLDGDTIRETLFNPSDYVDSVVYEIIPYGPGSLMCDGYRDTVTIWVNPTPEIDVQVADTLICNDSDVLFDVDSLVSTYGVVRYRLDVDYSGVTGDLTTGDIHDIGLLPDHLFNPGNTVDTVTYTFEPFIENGATHSDCFDGIPVVIRIYVNPTPRIDVTINDGFTDRCNDLDVQFNTSSPIISTTGILSYRVFAEYGLSLSGNNPSGTRTAGESVVDHPFNAGFDVDSVTYTFVPYILGATNSGDCEEGDSVKITLAVNPTPSIKADIVDLFAGNDTIFCNGSMLDFSIGTDIIGTTGTLLYDLFITGDTLEITGESESSGAPIVDFSNTLSHLEDSIQYLYYSFEPFIDNATSPDCYNPSNDTLVRAGVVPVLKVTETPDTVYVGGNRIRCFGETTGITMDPDGGDYRFFYNYQLENSDGDPLGQTSGFTDHRTTLPADTFYYRVTDNIGCFLLDSFVLSQPDLLELDSFIFDEPLCPGLNTGSADITVTGGIPDYDYLWSNINDPTYARETEDVYDLSVGEYSLTVTDTNLCVYFQEFDVTAPEEIDLQIVDKSEFGNYNIQCFRGSNGSIEAGAQGGNPPYTYRWFDSDTVEIPNNGEALLDSVPAGIYYYSVIDDNGCTTDPELQADILTEPDSITITKVDPSYPGGWDISCYGLEDGFIHVIYSGGHISAQPNTFSWTGPGIETANQNDSIQSGMPAGEYTVRITDFQGCTGMDTISLHQPPEILNYISSSKDPAVYNGRDLLCYGDSSGYVVLDSVTGGGTLTGQGIYTYHWDPVVTYPSGFAIGSPSEMNQDSLVAGTYELTITDQIGCSIIDTLVLDTTPRLYALLDIDTTGTIDLPKNGYEIRCFNGADGTVTFSPQGGTPDYSYRWEGITLTETTISNISEGTYQLEISDVNACYTSYELEFESPPPIMINYDSMFINCFGGLGSVDINPDGGHPDSGYSFEWSWDEGLSTDEDLADVPAGTYDIRIYDLNQCYKDSSITLYEGSEMIVSLDVTSVENPNHNGRDISCFGASDGEVTAFVTGGSPDYSYSWDGFSDTDPVIDGLSEGWYSVNVTDFFGCVASDSIFVEQPDMITITLDSETQDPLCSGDNTGRIGLIVTGGTGPYWYNWPHDESLVGNIAEGLEAGSYTIEIEDVNECSDSISVTLESPQPLELEIETTPAECKDASDGSITVFPSGGTFGYTIEMNGIPDDDNGFFDRLGPGYYSVVVTDGNGCVIRDDSVHVEALSESCVFVPNAFTPNGDGVNDVWIIDDEGDGTTDMILYPEAELRIYNRWGELIYYTNDVVGEPWDGTYRGRLLPIDSYYYVLDLNNGDPSIRGNVTIIY